MGAMRDLLVLVVHLITMVFQLTRPGGLRAVVAESVLIKHQMLILNRSRGRAPNLRIQDRLIAGFCSLWIKPSRFRKVALAFRTSTLLGFHRALVRRKYRMLFSPKQRPLTPRTSPSRIFSRLLTAPAQTRKGVKRRSRLRCYRTCWWRIREITRRWAFDKSATLLLPPIRIKINGVGVSCESGSVNHRCR